jgi:hypothetical protein
MLVADMETYKHGGSRKNQDGSIHLETRAKLAKAAEVSSSSVARAKKIKKHSPEDAQDIRDGKTTVGAVEKKIRTASKEKAHRKATVKVKPTQLAISILDPAQDELPVDMPMPIETGSCEDEVVKSDKLTGEALKDDMQEQVDTVSSMAVINSGTGVIQAEGLEVRVAPLPDGAAIYTAVFEERRRSRKTMEERKMYVFACLNELIEGMHIAEGKGFTEDIRHWYAYSNKQLDERQLQRLAPRQ